MRPESKSVNAVASIAPTTGYLREIPLVAEILETSKAQYGFSAQRRT